MAKLTPIEEEIVEGFEENMLEANRINTADPREDIRNIISKMKRSRGAVYDDAFIVVDWDRFFDENVCPNCKDRVTLRESAYACKKCGLTVPLKLYDESRERNNLEKEHQKKGMDLQLKIKNSGLSKPRVNELYRLGVLRAQEKLAGGNAPEEKEEP